MLGIETQRHEKGPEPTRAFFPCRSMKVGLRTVQIYSAGEMDKQAVKGAGTHQSFHSLPGHERVDLKAQTVH